MSVRMPRTTQIRNLAELLARLGDIPPERIRFNPPPGTATVDDVLEIEAREGLLCELVDGVLVEKPMGFTESRIAVLLATALTNFAEQHDLGIVTGESGMIRMPANLVRIPDVAYFRWSRFPSRTLPQEGAPEVTPDLAVEVLSKSNTAREMERKLGEYFAVGTKLVWFIDPLRRTATVYASPTKSKIIDASGALDGGKILLGFKMPLATLFKDMSPPAKRRRK